jgi:hypothetical protein
MCNNSAGFPTAGAFQPLLHDVCHIVWSTCLPVEGFCLSGVKEMRGRDV